MSFEPRNTARRRTPSKAGAFSWAAERFDLVGVNVEHALRRLGRYHISIQCWQGDDVGGFEQSPSSLGGGLAVTGNYPGKARTPDELRSDLEAAFRLIPGKHRLNLHAIYGEFGGRRVERDMIEPIHFRGWIDWANSHRLGLDFNPTFFSHAKSESGWTLAHRDPSIRRFWINHGKRCREIAAAIGRSTGTPCLNNVWIPDGSKDIPADRSQPRDRLTDSLDQLFSVKFSPKDILDSVEPKLFGLGSESYVAGSHEFYTAYALRRNLMLCLDLGHFHPTEEVADKISALLPFLPGLLIHFSRGVRWDSDHVPVLSDPLLAVSQEVVRADGAKKIHLGLDYFDASIHRTSAWVLGARAVLKSLLIALLEPSKLIRECEKRGDLTGRLSWQETTRTLPWPLVWEEYCRRSDVPDDHLWIREARAYEQRVLPARS